MSFLVLCLLSFLALLFYNFYWKRRNLPPGPTPFPIVGNMLEVARIPPGYAAPERWAREFGPVHTYWMGEKPVVSVADYALIKETFIKDGENYTGRIMFKESMKYLMGGTYGIFSTEGAQWRSQRRFALHVLRNYGMGRNLLESTIMREIQTFTENVDENNASGKTEQDVTPFLDRAVGSIINQMFFGYRFIGEKQKEFCELKQILNEQEDMFAEPGVFLVLDRPNLRFLPYFSSCFKRLKKSNDKLMAFFDRQIDNYQPKELDEDDEEPSIPYVEAFFREMRKPDRPDGVYTKEELRACCSDIWSAGQETTSITLSFAVLYLLLDQRVQQKMQRELDAVLAADESVTMAHRTQLPYTNAVVNEVQRMCNLLPLNLEHKTMADVVVGGYHVKAGTAIVPQLSTVMYNEKAFPEPMRFNPERFIDGNGDLRKIEEFIPFSIGKRQCLGESLARTELFLFTANIFHQFKVLPSDPLNPPTSAKRAGFGVRPFPYTCRMSRRNFDAHQISFGA